MNTNHKVKPLPGRERLLAAALHSFTTDGYDGASIRDIGRKAGLTNPALYRHFSGKDALGAELYRLCYAQIVSALESAATEHTDPLEKIAAGIDAVCRLIERDLPVFLYVDENQTRFWPVIQKKFGARAFSQIVAGWLRAGRRAGVIDTTIPEAVQLALAMGCLSEWAALRAAHLVPASQGRDLGKAVRRALAAGQI